MYPLALTAGSGGGAPNHIRRPAAAVSHPDDRPAITDGGDTTARGNSTKRETRKKSTGRLRKKRYIHGIVR